MEVECAVCLQVYDEGEHTPRVLSCGHSVCQSCVAELQLHWGAGSGEAQAQRTQGGGGLVRCPECKQHTKVPLGGRLALPKNIELMRLIQAVPPPRIARNSGESIPRVVKEEGPTGVHQQGDEDSEFPQPLFECFYGEPAIWILPQAAVKRRKSMVYGFCVGVFSCDKKLQSNSQEVRLQFLSRIDPNEKEGSRGLKYTELVRSAWNKLHHEVRTKLMHLLALGWRCNYFAEIAGLWMSVEGSLFLASKVYVEGIRQARNLLFPATENSSSDHCSAEGENTSYDNPEENNIGRSSLRTLIRLGVELCEILMEIHAAGLVVGILGPDSFVLDKYGHFRFHVWNSTFWRPCIGETSTLSNMKFCMNYLGVCFLIEEEIDKKNSLCSDSLNSTCEHLSPEILEILKKPVNAEKEAGISSLGSGDKAEAAILTEKADVWSLGYLLLQLLSGSSLLGDLTASEVHGDEHGKGAKQEILEENVRLKEQLLNCMANVPSIRPRVVDIWWELKHLLDDQALCMPPHLPEDSKQDKLGVEIGGSGSFSGNPPSYNCWIEPETATEERASGSEDLQTSTIETIPDAPSLPRALIDVEECNVKTLQGHLDAVSSLCICGSYVISASYDKTLRVWSLSDYKTVQVFEGHEQRITAIAAHEASGLCFSGDYGGRIHAWNIASIGNSASVTTWLEHQDWRFSGVASLAISNDEFLYSGSGDRTIKAWSTVDFQHVAMMEGHKDVVSTLMVDGQMLYSGSWDGTVRLWWRPDHSPLANFGGATSVFLGGIRALVKCPTPNGLLFAGHDSGVIQIWNEEDCVGSLKAHTGVVSALAFDQSWLYSISWDGFIKAWALEDILSGAPISVERKCSQAAVTALCCGQDKLFVGVMQKIQVYSREVFI
ncbi:uncharacterized protein [Physcomitrium patens]|uniref:Protein kinase domain-containing protein n=1 Tax=Physcomitrium patens TaxID=3218 RepID=A9RYI7_PHYPA|nr:uncharacterized protein LOC112291631 [Physcomitrium patens]PNR40973.1 hypothetical protein PHYPA_018376 [Physcomitrium patens]|eukprot:XP_024395086.1 uncharacterized protein LOC112291631 [Physcomitrella patens]